tara:strand:+ start:335 stop:505 length:171 start_codon:yes stop_codon:yes gene_type:complete
MTADRDSYFTDDHDVVLPETEQRKPLLLQAKIIAPLILMVLLTVGSIMFLIAMNSV